MRRILVEAARRKQALKRGGDLVREGLPDIAAPAVSVDLIALDEALERLSNVDTEAAEVVKLRFFAGLTVSEAAAALGVSPRKVDGLLGLCPSLAPH